MVDGKDSRASGLCGLTVSIGAVVHSFKQQDGFTVHGLREEVNSHSSHWTESGSSHAVRRSSTETFRQTIYSNGVGSDVLISLQVI